MHEFLSEWKRYFTFAALLSCFVNFLQLTFSFYMFTIYRNVVVSYSSYSLFSITVAAIFSLSFLGLFHFVRSRLLYTAGRYLNEAVLEKIYCGTIKQYAAGGSRVYARGVEDIGVLRDFLSSNALNSIFDVPWSPFYLIILFFIHPVLGVVSFFGAAMVVALGALQEVLVRKEMSDANAKNADNQKFINSFFNNIEVINGMGMSEAVTDIYEKRNKEVILSQTKSSLYAGAVQAAIKPLQNIIQVLIYCLGAYYAMTEGFSVGLMVVASIIMGRSLGPVMQVTAGWKNVIQSRDAFKRLVGLNDFIDSQPEKMDLPLPKGNYDVSSVVFAQNGRLILKGLDFKINSGEFLGLIGPSGAGKTTLCKLMLGIWPSTYGNIFLDGMDVFKWDKEEAGKVIGYLPQEVDFFPGTIAQNISRLQAPDTEKMESVINICGIEGLIESLPDGLDTVLEKDGSIGLSGGQKQILGLARALYNSPSILILDEPASNLDEQAELFVINALKRIKSLGKTTCVIVTHKPSLLQVVDNILVLRDGLVEQYGPKDKVFAGLLGNRTVPDTGDVQK